MENKIRYFTPHGFDECNLPGRVNSPPTQSSEFVDDELNIGTGIIIIIIVFKRVYF